MIEGYTADKEVVTGTMPANNVEVIVTYTINSYDLTINYVYEDGSKAKDSYTNTLNYNENYNVTTPVIEGYTADKTVVTGKMPANNVEVTVTYTINSYDLTINYVYEDGSKAKDSYTNTLNYNGNYNVTSPVIEGYTADKTVVTGTMPAEDVEVTVTYTKNTYNVIYKITGSIDTNNNYKTETYEYGADITKLDNLSKEGYTFSGWSEVPATMPAENVIVTGYFEAINVTLTKTAVDSNGNEVLPLYQYRAGDTVKYRLTVTNNGNLPISEYTVTDTLPQELRFASSEGITGNTLTWNIENLAAGQTATRTITTILNDSSTWQTKTSSDLANINKPSTTKDGEANCLFSIYTAGTNGEIPVEDGKHHEEYKNENYEKIGFGRVTDIAYNENLSSIDNLDIVKTTNNTVVNKIVYAPDYDPGEGKVVLWYVAKDMGYDDGPHNVGTETKFVRYHVDGIVVDVNDVYSIRNTVTGLYGAEVAYDIIQAKKPSNTSTQAAYADAPSAQTYSVASYTSSNLLTRFCLADITETEKAIKTLEQIKTENTNINNNLTTNTNNEENKEEVKNVNEVTNTTNTVVEETTNNVETITNVIEDANNIVEEVNGETVNTVAETNKEETVNTVTEINEEETTNTVESEIAENTDNENVNDITTID